MISLLLALASVIITALVGAHGTSAQLKKNKKLTRAGWVHIGLIAFGGLLCVGVVTAEFFERKRERQEAQAAARELLRGEGERFNSLQQRLQQLQNQTAGYSASFSVLLAVQEAIDLTDEFDEAPLDHLGSYYEVELLPGSYPEHWPELGRGLIDFNAVLFHGEEGQGGLLSFTADRYAPERSSVSALYEVDGDGNPVSKPYAYKLHVSRLKLETQTNDLEVCLLGADMESTIFLPHQSFGRPLMPYIVSLDICKDGEGRYSLKPKHPRFGTYDRVWGVLEEECSQNDFEADFWFLRTRGGSFLQTAAK
jgi:hypothetical protein